MDALEMDLLAGELDSLTAAIEEERFRHVAGLEPERAAELARMMALPDAEKISADQMAYRRRVAAEIDAVEPAENRHAA